MTDDIKSNYKPNSHKSKAKAKDSEKESEKEERVIKPKIIDGEAKTRKKGWGSKIASTFFSQEDLGSVGTYLVFDVVIPAMKSMISDAASQGVERMLFGEVRRSSSSGKSRTSYGTMYKSSASSARELSPRARATHDFNEVILETRREAEDVILGLSDIISEYDVATVSDLYELVGVTGSFQDDKWGWFNMKDATVQRIRAGYLVNLPPTDSID